MLDAYYTPDWLALELAASLPEGLSGKVIDPTVGTGALLSAVEARFGDRVQLLGIDLAPDVVYTLRRENPSWTIGRADFLNRRARGATRAWRAAAEGVAAVVLNPPFSYRGNGGVVVKYNNFSGRVAPAMRFLIEVLTGVQPAFGIYAVLPDGALEAERNDALWEEIAARFQVTRITKFKTTSFRGARVSTSLVSFERGAPRELSPVITTRNPPQVAGCSCVEVIRGRVPVHRVRGLVPTDPAPFLHTTTLGARNLRADAEMRLADDAPLVLMGRVGKWHDPAVLEVGKAVLSDCLIGLRPRSRAKLEDLRAAVLEARLDLIARYRGTGAPYLTLSSVVSQLEAIGWHPHVVRAGSAVGACCCGGALTDIDCFLRA